MSKMSNCANVFLVLFLICFTSLPILPNNTALASDHNRAQKGVLHLRGWGDREQLIQYADEDLYAAKQSERNTVYYYSDEGTTEV
jgi:hypothetical protein